MTDDDFKEMAIGKLAGIEAMLSGLHEDHAGTKDRLRTVEQTYVTRNSLLTGVIGVATFFGGVGAAVSDFIHGGH